ncbi:hypothetical protein JCGZ_10868 [Jatropha curcas]|uniref:Uncharacterized protein n=1 Tax=Jatropha curcas TaxID=180498 RepID=A0A067KT71_JATCU|nr:hypothetical protein JCGZ_10868 [Jatropha curcas]
MAKSSSISSYFDSLTEKELQLLKKLTQKYEKQESRLKKSVVESSSGKGKSKSKIEKLKGKAKISASHGKGKTILSPNPLMCSYIIDWKFFGKPEFNFRELLEFQRWMEFLSLNKPCYESVVKEFYGSLKATSLEVFSVKVDGETSVTSS